MTEHVASPFLLVAARSRQHHTADDGTQQCVPEPVNAERQVHAPIGDVPVVRFVDVPTAQLVDPHPDRDQQRADHGPPNHHRRMLFEHFLPRSFWHQPKVEQPNLNSKEQIGSILTKKLTICTFKYDNILYHKNAGLSIGYSIHFIEGCPPSIEGERNTNYLISFSNDRSMAERPSHDCRRELCVSCWSRHIRTAHHVSCRNSKSVCCRIRRSICC